MLRSGTRTCRTRSRSASTDVREGRENIVSIFKAMVITALAGVALAVVAVVITEWGLNILWGLLALIGVGGIVIMVASGD